MGLINRGFVGVPTFLRTAQAGDLEALDALIAILGVPFDEGSPFLPGSRMGPRALREHSLRFGTSGLYDPETRRSLLAEELTQGAMVDAGDVDIAPTNVERSFDNITASVAAILRSGALPVVLGGDHSISYPVFRALERPAHVIQFDAHMDYSPIENGLQFTNSHAFRHIGAMPTALSLTQVGIRSMRSSRAEHEEMIAAGHRVIPMGEFRSLGPQGVSAPVPANSPVYVSIDVDVLDMALIPGCVSAEPNGLTYGELRTSLRCLAERHDIVGFDFVEVNPPLDIGTGATAYLGALLVSEFLGEICAQPRWAEHRRAWLAGR
jgi:agmatinase